MLFAVTPEITSEAIRLRQQRNTSLGDALVSATAAHRGMTLATHSVTDCTWTDGLGAVTMRIC